MNTLITLLIIFYSIPMTTTTIMSKLHSCYLESYTEFFNIRDCLNTPIEIETTRCRGQCYSEDYLIYDWKAEPTHYRHKHYIHCCTPNVTTPREYSVMCHNKQIRTIRYSSILRCECKTCTDHCDG